MRILACKDCSNTEFTMYNKDKGILCCSKCGQLKQVANPLIPGYAFCPNCEAIKPTRTEPLENVSNCKEFKGGDICCNDCHFIIATIYRKAS